MDFNITNADDGLAIDDFFLTPNGTPISPLNELQDEIRNPILAGFLF